MKLQFVRHATILLSINDLKLLVDPMFSPANSMDPSPNTLPQRKNPLVDLPEAITLNSLLSPDAVLITHTHRDHWDDEAIRLLPKSTPIFCQSQDATKIRDSGFTDVTSVSGTLSWNGIKITQTVARHGRGEMGEKMGPVSGYVLEATSEPSVYITGDTVWCTEVKEVCHRKHPDVIVTFAGGAEFTSGGPITMTAEDVYQLSKSAPMSRIVAVHMEAWNHCSVMRGALGAYLRDRDIDNQVFIPIDGEIIEF